MSRHGAHLVVKDDDNKRHTCISTKKFSHIVCGDYVTCRVHEHDRDQIVEIFKRSNELKRKTEYANKTVAANIDTILIVSAAEPTPSLELIDHYLLAAELLPAQAVIVINKTDLTSANKLINDIELKYKHLPYAIFQTDKNNTSTLKDLSLSLKNKTCIFVGQSGVGKSTLINSLIPNLAIETQAISEQISQGRHTTSTTTLYDLPDGGEIIDSPGVRDFTIPELDINCVLKGFIEIDEISKNCKFHDCKHINEPKCAVKSALELSKISQQRYQSYKNLLETLS